MNMDEVGDAIPEAGGADTTDKTDSRAGICPFWSNEHALKLTNILRQVY